MDIRNPLLPKQFFCKMKSNQKSPFVSIIIPTFNRSEILVKALLSLFAQDYDCKKFEILIVDDGSTDDTKKLVSSLKNKNSSFDIKYFYQKNKGPAAARNIAIKESRGEIILILNDDTISASNLVSKHIKFHKKFSNEKYGLLGFVTWSPELTITPFMKWLEEGGPQTNYGKLEGNKAEWWHFWTCNISLKKSFIQKIGDFDESFPYAAWEDIEYGYRMGLQGLKLVYDQTAIGYHYHPTSLRSMVNKMKEHGASAVVLGEKVEDKSYLPPLAVPKLAEKLDFFDRIVFTANVEKSLYRIAEWLEKRFVIGKLFDVLLLHYRIVGRREYLKQHAIKIN